MEEDILALRLASTSEGSHPHPLSRRGRDWEVIPYRSFGLLAKNAGKRDNRNVIEWVDHRLYKHLCRKASCRLPAGWPQSVVSQTSYAIKARIERRQLLALRRTNALGLLVYISSGKNRRLAAHLRLCPRIYQYHHTPRKEIM